MAKAKQSLKVVGGQEFCSFCLQAKVRDSPASEWYCDKNCFEKIKKFTNSFNFKHEKAFIYASFQDICFFNRNWKVRKSHRIFISWEEGVSKIIASTRYTMNNMDRANARNRILQQEQDVINMLAEQREKYTYKKEFIANVDNPDLPVFKYYQEKQKEIKNGKYAKIYQVFAKFLEEESRETFEYGIRANHKGSWNIYRDKENYLLQDRPQPLIHTPIVLVSNWVFYKAIRYQDTNKFEFKKRYMNIFQWQDRKNDLFWEKLMLFVTNQKRVKTFENWKRIKQIKGIIYYQKPLSAFFPKSFKRKPKILPKSKKIRKRKSKHKYNRR